MEGSCRATPASKAKIACDEDDTIFFQTQIFDIFGNSKIDKKDSKLAKLKESFSHELKQET